MSFEKVDYQLKSLLTETPISIFSMKDNLTKRTCDATETNLTNNAREVNERKEVKHVIWWKDATKKILNSLSRRQDDDDVASVCSNPLSNDSNPVRRKSILMSAINQLSEKLDSNKKNNLTMLNRIHSYEPDDAVEQTNDVPVSNILPLSEEQNSRTAITMVRSVSDNLSNHSLISDNQAFKSLSSSVADNIDHLPHIDRLKDKQLVICFMCKNLLTRPKLLQCLHSFCELCLTRLFNENPQSIIQLSIKCPVCRHETALPRSGIAALPVDSVAEALITNSNRMSITQTVNQNTDQSVVTCRHCFKREAQWACSTCSFSALCDLCNTVVHVMETKEKLGGSLLLGSHCVTSLHKTVQAYTGKEAAIMLGCSNHEKLEAFAFCLTCSIPICHGCKQNSHESHTTTTPFEAASIATEELKMRLCQLEEATRTNRERWQSAVFQRTETIRARTKLLEDVDNRHQLLKSIVDKWYKTQCEQLSQLFSDRLNMIATISSECNERHVSLDQTRLYMENALKMEHWFNLLQFYSFSKHRLTSLVQNNTEFPSAINNENFIIALTPTHALDSIEKMFGSVQLYQTEQIKNLIDFNENDINEKPLQHQQQNGCSKRVTLLDSPLDQTILPKPLNKCENKRPESIVKKRMSGISPSDNCQSNVSPTIDGIRKSTGMLTRLIDLKMCLFPLSHSFSTRPTSGVDACSNLSTGSISLSQDGKKLIVTDRAHHSVSIYDGEGCLLRQIKCRDNLMHPHSAIILTNSDDIVVASEGVHEQKAYSLVVFNSTGVYKTHLDTDPEMQPCAVATNYLGTFVAYDRNKRCLHVFDSENYCELYRSKLDVGEAGFTPGNIWDSVTVNKAGSVYVSSFLGHCVDHFSSKLRRLAKYGSRGKAADQLQGPAGLCVDFAGNVIVADSLNGRLQVITRDGHLKQVTMKAGASVCWPVGVAMDDTGKTYILEHDGTVKIFQYA